MRTIPQMILDVEFVAWIAVAAAALGWEGRLAGVGLAVVAIVGALACKVSARHAARVAAQISALEAAKAEEEEAAAVDLGVKVGQQARKGRQG